MKKNKIVLLACLLLISILFTIKLNSKRVAEINDLKSVIGYHNSAALHIGLKHLKLVDYYIDQDFTERNLLIIRMNLEQSTGWLGYFKVASDGESPEYYFSKINSRVWDCVSSIMKETDNGNKGAVKLLNNEVHELITKFEKMVNYVDELAFDPTYGINYLKYYIVVNENMAKTRSELYRIMHDYPPRKLEQSIEDGTP